MTSRLKSLGKSFQPLAVVLAALCAIAGDTSAAFAQNQNCTQIISVLRGIENNNAYRSFQGISTDLRNRQAQVRQAESEWVRSGCQASLNAGQALDRSCQSIAQTITSGRNQVQGLNELAQEGQSLARNREQLLQQYARFNCSAGQSGVTFSDRTQPGGRGALLDEIFGGGEGGYDYIDTPYDPWSQMATRRTVCVRTCDGYYWPVSFSTVDQYINQDAITCHNMCPGSEVLLFSYRNPGEEPEDMISLSGVPYRSTPYAFKFRAEFNKECSCQQAAPVGTIAMSEGAGQSRAVIDFGELSFPLPQPDPRDLGQTTVAEAIYVPLPRPRPREDGTYAPAVSGPDVESARELRIVNFGQEPVRIVGPRTPFAPEGEEEL